MFKCFRGPELHGEPSQHILTFLHQQNPFGAADSASTDRNQRVISSIKWIFKEEETDDGWRRNKDLYPKTFEHGRQDDSLFSKHASDFRNVFLYITSDSVCRIRFRPDPVPHAAPGFDSSGSCQNQNHRTSSRWLRTRTRSCDFVKRDVLWSSFIKWIYCCNKHFTPTRPIKSRNRLISMINDRS